MVAVCPTAVTLPDLQGVHAAWRFIAPASRKHKCAKVTRPLAARGVPQSPKTPG